MLYRITSNHNGFSSNLIHAISQLWSFDMIERDRNDGKSDIAFVDWSESSWFYAEAEPVHGTRNVWEYYFEQPMEPQFGLGVIDGIPEYDLKHDQYAERQFCLNDVRSLIKKYIKVKDHVKQKVDSTCKMFKGRVLGVHYRDTDMPLIHGRSTSIEVAFEKIQTLRDKFDMIFLATECSVALSKFQDWANQQSIELLYSDCFRVAPGRVESFTSRDDVKSKNIVTQAHQLHIHEYELLNAPRPLHKYKLGLEVLLDILVLSKCTYFLHGYSGVANSAVFFGEIPKQNIFSYS